MGCVAKGGALLTLDNGKPCLKKLLSSFCNSTWFFLDSQDMQTLHGAYAKSILTGGGLLTLESFETRLGILGRVLDRFIGTLDLYWINVYSLNRKLFGVQHFLKRISD